MIRTNDVLDAAQTGREAQILETSLRQRIVGQDEAIENLVQAYQTYRGGHVESRQAYRNLIVSRSHGVGKDANGGGHGREPCSAMRAPSSKSIARNFNTATKSRNSSARRPDTWDIGKRTRRSARRY